MHNVKLYPRLESIVAHSDELEEQMGDITFALTLAARGLFAKHHKTGEHRITQTKGRVDHFVNLEGEAAVSVELGHYNARTKTFTPGIHVLEAAVNQETT